ncbi:MAG TPA: fumarylacetoacetate hydrolase family protein, partial [Thermoanaerobaculia bacterium]|nr:fumarylacetoacetate hydrolase family protein [Thermoanaerobaculia bacterium]
MRLVRFAKDGAGSYGVVEGEALQPLAGAPWSTGGVPKEAGEPLDRRVTPLLVPVVPTKILGVGRNYRAHAQELGNEVPKEPLIFYKPPSSLLPHHGRVVLPKDAGRVDFEGELALVVGARARNVAKENWRDVIFGLTCAL